MRNAYLLYYALLAAGPLAALGRAAAGFSYFRAQLLAACGFALFAFIYMPVYLRLRQAADAAVPALPRGPLVRLLPAVFLCAGAAACFASGGPLLLGGMLEWSGYEMWVPWAMFFVPLLAGRLAWPLAARLGCGKALAWCALAALAGLMCVFTGTPAAITAGLALAGLGMANMLPLLVFMIMEAAPGRGAEVYALAAAALSGGAALPPLMGLASGAFSPLFGFLAPMAALVYVLAVAAAGQAAAEDAEEPEEAEEPGEQGPAA